MTNLEYRELRDLRKEREKNNELLGFVLCMQALSLALLIIIWVMILVQNAKAEEIEIRPAANAAALTAVITIESEEVPAETEAVPCEDDSHAYEYLGVFTTTGYCNCRKCCGKWAGGPTASGKMPKAQHTVAVDPKVIPLGTHLLVNGIEYVAEDTGSGVNGMHLDIYYDSHQTAWNHGVQHQEVWMIK